MEERTLASERPRTREPAGRFDQVSIAMHWVTAGLLACQFTAAWLVSKGGHGATVALAAKRV